MAKKKPTHLNFKNLSERRLQEENDKKASIDVYDKWKTLQKQLKKDNPNYVIPPVPPEIQEGYEICDMINKASKFRKNWIQEARRDYDPSDGPVPSVFELAKRRREQMKNGALIIPKPITHKMDAKTKLARRRELREQRNKFREDMLNGQLTGEKLDKLHPRQLNTLKKNTEKKIKKFLEDHKVEHMEKIAANPALANVPYEKPQIPADWLKQLDEVARRRQRLYGFIPGETNQDKFLEDDDEKGDDTASIASDDSPSSSQLNRNVTRALDIKPLNTLGNLSIQRFDQIGFGQQNRGFDQQNRGGFDERNEGFNQQSGGRFNQANDNFDQQNRRGFDQQNNGFNQANSFDQQNRGGFDERNEGGFDQQNRGGIDERNEGFNRQNSGGFNQTNNSFDQRNRGGFNQQNRGGFDQQNRGGFDRQNVGFNQQNQGFRQQSRGFDQQNQSFGQNNGNQNFTQTRETCFDQQNIGPNQPNGEFSQQNQSFGQNIRNKNFTQTRETRVDQQNGGPNQTNGRFNQQNQGFGGVNNRNQSFTQIPETRFDQKYHYKKAGYTNKPSSNIFNADHSRKRNYKPNKKEQEKFRQENEWKRKF